MKAFQKVLSLLLILCLIVAVCPVLTANAETNEYIVRDEFGMYGYRQALQDQEMTFDTMEVVRRQSGRTRFSRGGERE